MSAWRAYQAHEVLGLALQSLFWTVYQYFEKQRPTLHSSKQVADWFISSLKDEFSDGFLESSFTEFLQDVAKNAPPVNEFNHARHERTLCKKFLPRGESSTVQSVEAVLLVLATLLHRLPDGRLYEGFSRNDAYFDGYPLNLRRLRARAEADWSELSVRTWLNWLIVNWGVGQHQRVALRKLRAQGQDSFRLRPTERGLVPVGNIEVTFSNPRLNEALRAFQDLGLVDGALCLTGAGVSLKDELDA